MVRTSLRPADLLDLTAWPKGMRVIMRRERPHQGAQLRFEDVGGYRLTAFATSTRVGSSSRQTATLRDGSANWLRSAGVAAKL